MTFSKEAFQKDLIETEMNLEEIVSKYYLDQPSFFFHEILKDTKKEYTLKREIAESLKVYQRDIILVGSGKLGFSLAPDEEMQGTYSFRNFRTSADKNLKKSDLDFAIVDNQYFEYLTSSIFDKINSGDLTPSSKEHREFCKYFFKGWIRPNFLADKTLITDELWTLLRKNSEELNIEINFGIYRNWKYLYKYHENNLRLIRNTYRSL